MWRGSGICSEQTREIICHVKARQANLLYLHHHPVIYSIIPVHHTMLHGNSVKLLTGMLRSLAAVFFIIKPFS